MFNPELLTLFRNSGYLVRSDATSVRILTRVNALLITTLLILSGLILLVIGTVEDKNIGMMGLVLVLVPFVHGKFRYPSRVIFRMDKPELHVYYNSWIPIIIPYQSIEGILQDRIIQSTSASPFRKGTQRFVYRYSLQTRDKDYRIIRLASYEELDKLAGIFVVIFKQLIRIRTTRKIIN